MTEHNNKRALNMEPKITRSMTVPEYANVLRADIKNIENQVRSLMTWHGMSKSKDDEVGYPLEGEIKAHIMLAVRHLEDARMRLGKVIQYSGSGDSCYDK